MGSGIMFDGVNTTRPGWAHESVGADGSVRIRALAHAALTAKTPYLVYMGYDGPQTLAAFDSGLASTSAAAFGGGNWKVGVPNEAIASGVEGWLQTGGYCGSVTTPSTTITQGNCFYWHDASLTAATYPQASATINAGYITVWGIGYTSASATLSHNITLLNKFVFGDT